MRVPNTLENPVLNFLKGQMAVIETGQIRLVINILAAKIGII
jgi:hypothetical protein